MTSGSNAALAAEETRAAYAATLQPPLVAHFDRIAQSTDGVARLRELILSLAVQGKLVPQNAADEPASMLLERIRAEKAKLAKEGKIRKEKPLAEIADDEKPFELPASWEWARLPDIYCSISPSSNKLLASAINEIGRFPVVDQGKRFIAGYTDDESLLIRLPGPVIVFGDHTTEVKYVPFDFVAGADGVKVLRPVAQNEKFFFFQLLGYQLEDRGYARHFKVLNANLFALPPLAEQSRIVARVEELMALCDALAAKGRLETEQHARLTGTLFDALAASESAHALAENWQRVAAHFDLLLDRPEAVDALEQTLLQLAVRGLLVPQDPADEPAGALLQKIRAEKDRLIATGRIKRDKSLPPVAEDQLTDLPTGWIVATIPELCAIGGGATPSKTKAAYWDGNIPWVSPKDMKVDFIFDSQDHVSAKALEETRLPLVPSGSLLIVVRGMILAHSFPLAVTQMPVTINQDMKALTPVLAELAPYLALVCLGFKRQILELVDRSTHGTCKLESEKLFSFRFGVPPLAEQSRIVARVAELRDLCADLHQRLAAARETQSRLAGALVESALA